MKRYFWYFYWVITIIFISTPPASPIVIQDIAGNKIEVPPYPKRVISLAPSITECIFAIGAGDRVVGVSRFSNYPKEVTNIPKVGSYIYPDIERILALKPHLCIATKDGNPKKLVYRLMQIGIKVFVVDPRDVTSLFHTMLVLGKVIGCEKKAKSKVEELKKEVKKIKTRAKSFLTRPRVFFQIGIDPMVTIGRDTLINNLIELAGGDNIFKDHMGYPRISVEQVIALNPDIIIITSMVHSDPALNRLKEYWQKYREIKAVKHKTLFVVNSDLFNRPSPRAIEGLKLLSMLFEKVQHILNN